MNLRDNRHKFVTALCALIQISFLPPPFPFYRFNLLTCSSPLHILDGTRVLEEGALPFSTFLRKTRASWGLSWGTSCSYGSTQELRDCTVSLLRCTLYTHDLYAVFWPNPSHSTDVISRHITLCHFHNRGSMAGSRACDVDWGRRNSSWDAMCFDPPHHHRRLCSWVRVEKHQLWSVSYFNYPEYVTCRLSLPSTWSILECRLCQVGNMTWIL